MQNNHQWNVTPTEAVQIQKKLRGSVVSGLYVREPELIGGADVSLNRFSDILYAGIIVLNAKTLLPVCHAVVKTTTSFPYIPGLLSFREVPGLIEAWQKLAVKPDILVVDGQGIAHPRRLGIASHIGVLLDIPTIGCAKSLLTGIPGELSQSKGSSAFIHDKYNHDEVIGAELRNKDKVKPVIISIGHKVTLEQSLEIMRACDRGYRIPEPTRQAHILVNQFRTGQIKE